MALPFIKGMTPFFIENLSTSMGFANYEKNQILDPISTAIRVSLLVYKPLYTKLSIDRNRIYFQEPTLIPILQGLLRKLNGDQRSDIHIIIISIEHLLYWYKIADKKIRFICDGVIRGLEKLSQCYSQDKQTNLVSQAIDFFIEKIKRDLGEIHDTSEEEDSNTSEVGHELILSDKQIEHNVKYEYFKSHWNDREIMIIYNQLKELEIDTDQDKRNSIIQSIDNFLTYKDNLTHKYFITLTKYNHN